MRRHLSARLRDDRGQTIAEFALAAAALLLLIFGGIALANGFDQNTLVITAARDGARLASIDCGAGAPNTYADVESGVYDDLSAGGEAVVGSPWSSAPSPPSPGAWGFTYSCSGGTALVTVWYDAPDLFPAVMGTAGMKNPRQFTESASASFPVE